MHSLGDEITGLEREDFIGRSELSAVLQSKAFARAPVRSRMLAYLCEKVLRGQAEDISEYSIAVEALGRKPDFNPESDSIVRVEALRLRQRLREFYASEGAGHAAHILLPDGGYVPQFVLRSTENRPSTAFGDPEKKGCGNQVSEEMVSAVPDAGDDDPRIPLSRVPWFRARPMYLVLAMLAAAMSVWGLLGFPGPWPPASRAAARFWVPSAALPPATGNGPVGMATSDEIRVLCGYEGESFVDGRGRVWLRDQWFTGGNATVQPLRRITGTRDERLYTTARTGDFRYDIPLRAGTYELHLRFSESLDEDLLPDSDGEDRRRFDVIVNGIVRLNRFDIVTDAGGPNIATERVFKDVSPAADGKLHLAFRPVKGEALLNGIEVLPSEKRHMRSIRILCGASMYSGAANASWAGDSYFRGGVATRHLVRIEAASDPDVYGGERYGNFQYSIPVADGTYDVALHFAEFVFGPGDTGRRVFDVDCNGSNLLRNFDILLEAGGQRRGIARAFHGLKPNAQGKLLFSFIPVKNYASVSAIEVVDESR